MATRGPAISLAGGGSITGIHAPQRRLHEAADVGYRAKNALIADWEAMDDVPGDTIGNDVSDRVRQCIDMIDEDIPGIGVLCNPVARER